MADGADLFREYATSGAFTLALSRNQVHGLSMCKDGAPEWLTALSALERKGLVQRIGPEGREVRLTVPGVHALALSRLAGLVNGDADEIESELTSLTTKLDTALHENARLREDNWSLAARLEKAELQVAVLEAERDGGGFSPPIVRLKDRQPSAPTSDLVHTP